MSIAEWLGHSTFRPDRSFRTATCAWGHEVVGLHARGGPHAIPWTEIVARRRLAGRARPRLCQPPDL